MRHKPLYEYRANGVSAIVVQGDCLDTIRAYEETPLRFQLVFFDPPFNIDHGYSHFNDRMSPSAFAQWLQVRTYQSTNILQPGGVLACHGPDELTRLWIRSEPIPTTDSLDWCHWHYRFAQCHRASFLTDRCHLLTYRKAGSPGVWNPDDVAVVSDRVKYKDKRVANGKNGKRLPGRIWGVPSDGPNWGRVQGGNKERWTLKEDESPTPDGPQCVHPNQLPSKYIERLLLAYTNPGDWIFDMCGGTGTVATVAQFLGRNSVTCEITSESCLSAFNRIKRGH